VSCHCQNAASSHPSSKQLPSICNACFRLDKPLQP
jgi:hypothetical protein